MVISAVLLCTGAARASREASVRLACDLLRPAEIARAFHEQFDTGHAGRNPYSCDYPVAVQPPDGRYVETVLPPGGGATDAFRAASRAADAAAVHGFSKDDAVFLKRSDTLWVRQGKIAAYVSAFLLEHQRRRASAALMELATIVRGRLRRLPGAHATTIAQPRATPRTAKPGDDTGCRHPGGAAGDVTLVGGVTVHVPIFPDLWNCEVLGGGAGVRMSSTGLDASSRMLITVSHPKDTPDPAIIVSDALQHAIVANDKYSQVEAGDAHTFDHADGAYAGYIAMVTGQNGTMAARGEFETFVRKDGLVLVAGVEAQAPTIDDAEASFKGTTDAGLFGSGSSMSLLFSKAVESFYCHCKPNF
jgi:hypothetical protein